MSNDKLLERIEELTAAVRNINLEIGQIRATLNQRSEETTDEPQPLPARAVLVTRNEAGFTIGDRVVVTNHYGKRRGIVGTIADVTKKQVTVRAENSDDTFIKRNGNVRLIN
jgi:hypothetical protein